MFLSTCFFLNILGLETKEKPEKESSVTPQKETSDNYFPMANNDLLNVSSGSKTDSPLSSDQTIDTNTSPPAKRMFYSEIISSSQSTVLVPDTSYSSTGSSTLSHSENTPVTECVTSTSQSEENRECSLPTNYVIKLDKRKRKKKSKKNSNVPESVVFDCILEGDTMLLVEDRSGGTSANQLRTESYGMSARMSTGGAVLPQGKLPVIPPKVTSTTVKKTINPRRGKHHNISKASGYVNLLSPTKIKNPNATRSFGRATSKKYETLLLSDDDSDQADSNADDGVVVLSDDEEVVELISDDNDDEIYEIDEEKDSVEQSAAAEYFNQGAHTEQNKELLPDSEHSQNALNKGATMQTNADSRNDKGFPQNKQTQDVHFQDSVNVTSQQNNALPVLQYEGDQELTEKSSCIQDASESSNQTYSISERIKKRSHDKNSAATFEKSNSERSAATVIGKPKEHNSTSTSIEKSHENNSTSTAVKTSCIKGSIATIYEKSNKVCPITFTEVHAKSSVSESIKERSNIINSSYTEDLDEQMLTTNKLSVTIPSNKTIAEDDVMAIESNSKNSNDEPSILEFTSSSNVSNTVSLNVGSKTTDLMHNLEEVCPHVAETDSDLLISDRTSVSTVSQTVSHLTIAEIFSGPVISETISDPSLPDISNDPSVPDMSGSLPMSDTMNVLDKNSGASIPDGTKSPTVSDATDGHLITKSDDQITCVQSTIQIVDHNIQEKCEVEPAVDIDSKKANFLQSQNNVTNPGIILSPSIKMRSHLRTDIGTEQADNTIGDIGKQSVAIQSIETSTCLGSNTNISKETEISVEATPIVKDNIANENINAAVISTGEIGNKKITTKVSDQENENTKPTGLLAKSTKMRNHIFMGVGALLSQIGHSEVNTEKTPEKVPKLDKKSTSSITKKKKKNTKHINMMGMVDFLHNMIDTNKKDNNERKMSSNDNSSHKRTSTTVENFDVCGKENTVVTEKTAVDQVVLFDDCAVVTPAACDGHTEPSSEHIVEQEIQSFK